MGIRLHRSQSGWAWRGLNILYLWKKHVLHRAGPAAQTLGSRVAQLEDELRRVEREQMKGISSRSRCVRTDSADFR